MAIFCINFVFFQINITNTSAKDVHSEVHHLKSKDVYELT